MANGISRAICRGPVWAISAPVFEPRPLSTMGAAFPTAGPTHSALELGERVPDTDIPRLRPFAGRNPTNPLVAREWRDIFPYRSCRGVSG